MRYYLDKDGDVWQSPTGAWLTCMSCQNPNLRKPRKYVTEKYGPLRELVERQPTHAVKQRKACGL